MHWEVESWKNDNLRLTDGRVLVARAPRSGDTCVEIVDCLENSNLDPTLLLGSTEDLVFVLASNHERACAALKKKAIAGVEVVPLKE